MLQIPSLFAHEATSNPVISGFCLEVEENCAFLGSYAASSGNSLLMSWDNLSVPSSKVSLSLFKHQEFFTLEDGTDRFPKMSVRNCHCSLCNSPEDHGCQLPTPCMIYSFWGKHQCRSCAILCPVIHDPSFSDDELCRNFLTMYNNKNKLVTHMCNVDEVFRTMMSTNHHIVVTEKFCK